MLRHHLYTGLATALMFGSLLASSPVARAQTADGTLSNLQEGMVLNGFRAEALYLDDADRPMGARFRHVRTGFVLDLLKIQSVPQGFIWVNSIPTSDMGEPHTQEHLLLGKGNNGRYTANLEGMSLSGSSAFTQQLRTCYDFFTSAGSEVFYQQFERRMNALLYPDYTDEEIRREVCNFGVSVNPGDSRLRLEEKGTVYNEMVSTFERPWTHLGYELDIATYGKGHPMTFVSGGLPSAIRVMQPEDIRRFHHDHYRLDNMGMVGSFPKEMKTDEILRRTDQMLNALQPGSLAPLNVMTVKNLPKPSGAAPGTIINAPYPSANEQEPAPLVFAWPAQLNLTPEEQLLQSLLVQNVASDETSNLYRVFIDTKTRSMDVGAQGVFGWASDDQGSPMYIGLDNLPQSNMTEEKIKAIRGRIMEELKTIASWGDNSPEVKEFNARMRNRVIEQRRNLAKFVNTPPGFGFRGTGSAWMNHLDHLAERSGFSKQVTLHRELGDIERLLDNGKNFWRDRIAAWRMLDQLPIACASHPSAALLAKETQERKERIDAEVARLEKHYGVGDDQAAIAKYRSDYDAGSAEIERLAATAKRATFIDSPPMTLDDQLDFKSTTLAGNVPMVASTFDNMTSATTGIALRLNGVADKDYVYLSLLPTLMTSAGIYENGRTIPYDEMSGRLREEILSLNASFSTNARTGRHEIVVRGSGNDLEESKRAITWMKRVLLYPDWRTENLPRLRDVVDQTLSGLRNTMKGPEEGWVNGPAAAYRWQDDGLMLATESFLTRAHNAHRLRWLLKDPGTPAEGRAIAGFLSHLTEAAKGASRADLLTLAQALGGSREAAAALPASMKEYMDEMAKLPGSAQTNAHDAAGDLAVLLGDIPDASLAHDWRYLCLEIRHDLLVPPAQALNEMNNLRRHLLVTGGARMFMIGSTESQQALQGSVNDLLGGLATMPMQRLPASNSRYVDARLLDRMPGAKPVFVGLVNPNTSSGVFLNSAPAPTYRDTSRDALLEILTGKLYSGHGSHGIFMKTWGAGLAYSNGLSNSPNSGRLAYYAERCPELPQTLRFVIDELKKAPRDTNLAEYAIALAFDESRAASGYESRGEAIAGDLADGTTPEVVRNFRKGILALRSSAGLGNALFDRMPSVYGKVLPGYGVKAADVRGGIFFVIGPEKQMALYEQYLQSAEGAATRLYRLYPRDFWMPADAKSIEESRP
ncbi:MAG TPA: hypothetical protein VHI13_20375 [Candidatus Kapabacteria bacterium]|nr:hypothetical protein [Candidatus Kapabacteria bacterium]